MSEKKSSSYQARGEYVFEVASDATKPAIRQAVERLFGVKVTGVWTMNMRGKARRGMGRATAGVRPSWKKAIVTLKAGDKIDIFEG